MFIKCAATNNKGHTQNIMANETYNMHAQTKEDINLMQINAKDPSQIMYSL